MKPRMIKFDCNHNKTEDAYKKLSKEHRIIVDKFEKYCLISAGVERSKKSKSNAIRFLLMVDKDIKNIRIEDLRDFLGVLKKSDFSDYSINDVKGFVQRFLKWYFKDYSKRFNDFEDIKLNSDAQRRKEIKPDDVLSSEDVGNLIKRETNIFWKAFIVCQYQGALRTSECRELKHSQIDKKDEDVFWFTIKSKKNRNGTDKNRTAPPLDNKAIYLLKELKKEQEEDGVISPYVFPSKSDDQKCISSGAVSKWFSRHTKKVLGRQVKNYILRHSKGEEFHKLIREGKLSKENALQMMGHSEKMFDKTYSHANKQEMKKLLKKQVLDVDYIAPEKKHKLEKKIEVQDARINELNNHILAVNKQLKIIMKNGHS